MEEKWRTLQDLCLAVSEPPSPGTWWCQEFALPLNSSPPPPPHSSRRTGSGTFLWGGGKDGNFVESASSFRSGCVQLVLTDSWRPAAERAPASQEEEEEERSSSWLLPLLLSGAEHGGEQILNEHINHASCSTAGDSRRAECMEFWEEFGLPVWSGFLLVKSWPGCFLPLAWSTPSPLPPPRPSPGPLFHQEGGRLVLVAGQNLP